MKATSLLENRIDIDRFPCHCSNKFHGKGHHIFRITMETTTMVKISSPLSLVLAASLSPSFTGFFH